MKISDSLQEYLVSSFEREESTSERKFYLSDMGKCMRTRWLKRKGIGTEFEPHVYWILQLGNLIHDYGYKALEAKGLLLEAEDSIRTEHWSGRFDGIVKNGKEKCVFDFKSTGSYQMNKVIGGEDSEENISQLLSYVMFLKEKRKDISDTAFVVYINKEPGNKQPINFFQREYHLTSWRRKQLKEEMDTLVNFWLKDKIPPCSCPSWMKDYNAFQLLCSAKEDKIKEILEYIKAGKKIISSKSSVVLLDGETKKEVLKI